MAKKPSGLEHMFVCIAELVIGVLLLLKPEGFTAWIISAMGAVFALTGLLDMVAYFKSPPILAAKGRGLAKGLTAIAFGLFCVFRTDWFLTAFPLITALYGVVTLVSSFVKIQWTVDLLRTKNRYWYMSLIGAGLSLVLAIVILTTPFEKTESLWLFVGAAMIMEAVVDGMAYHFRKKKAE